MKGKSKAPSDIHSEASSLPSRIFVNPPSHSPRPSPTNLDKLLAYIPNDLRSRLAVLLPVLRWVWIPLPLLALVMGVMAIRRRLRRRGVVAGAATVGVGELRERLRVLQRRGMGEWVKYWILWWVGKLKGVWEMGTTITYV